MSDFDAIVDMITRAGIHHTARRMNKHGATTDRGQLREIEVDEGGRYSVAFSFGPAGELISIDTGGY